MLIVPQSVFPYYFDSASDPDQEYIYFIGSETLPPACYTLSDVSSILFYSTSLHVSRPVFCAPAIDGAKSMVKCFDFYSWWWFRKSADSDDRHRFW